MSFLWERGIPNNQSPGHALIVSHDIILQVFFRSCSHLTTILTFSSSSYCWFIILPLHVKHQASHPTLPQLFYCCSCNYCPVGSSFILYRWDPDSASSFSFFSQHDASNYSVIHTSNNLPELLFLLTSGTQCFEIGCSFHLPSAKFIQLWPIISKTNDLKLPRCDSGLTGAKTKLWSNEKEILNCFVFWNCLSFYTQTLTEVLKWDIQISQYWPEQLFPKTITP